jgi:hypothetical protein
MADGRERVIEGSFPDSPCEGSYWEEVEYVDSGIFPADQLYGPSTRWVLWWTQGGGLYAIRMGGGYLLDANGIAKRWGDWLVRDFKDHVNAVMAGPGSVDEYDQWVTAMERHWEAADGK